MLWNRLQAYAGNIEKPHADASPDRGSVHLASVLEYDEGVEAVEAERGHVQNVGRRHRLGLVELKGQPARR